MKIDKEIKKALKNAGFKKKWLSDHSGFWYQKVHKYDNFKIIFSYDDVPTKTFYIEVCNKDKHHLELFTFKSLSEFLYMESNFKICL